MKPFQSVIDNFTIAVNWKTSFPFFCYPVCDMLEFQRSHVFHQLLCLIFVGVWEESFFPMILTLRLRVHLHQLQNTAVNPSNRQSINKEERISEAKMDGEAEKQRNLLGAHTSANHTHTYKNLHSFRASFK